MKMKLFGIYVCMLMVLPLVATAVTADPVADIEMKGGLGLQVTITNVGEEPLFDIIWCSMTTKLFKKEIAMSPGMSEPLLPGKSLSWKWRDMWRPIAGLFTFQDMPAVSYCTFDVKIYENGGDNTIYSEKSVDALFVFGWVIILS